METPSLASRMVNHSDEPGYRISVSVLVSQSVKPKEPCHEGFLGPTCTANQLKQFVMSERDAENKGWNEEWEKRRE